jgi:3-oxoacyl-[acyl-carrier protein] reductase
VADTFAPAGGDRLGRSLQPVTAATWTQQFTVDAMAAALMIGEFSRRHIARGGTWGRIIGLMSGAEIGFPEEVSYGAAKAAQASYTLTAPRRPPPGCRAAMAQPRRRSREIAGYWKAGQVTRSRPPLPARPSARRR